MKTYQSIRDIPNSEIEYIEAYFDNDNIIISDQERKRITDNLLDQSYIGNHLVRIDLPDAEVDGIRYSQSYEEIPLSVRVISDDKYFTFYLSGITSTSLFNEVTTGKVWEQLETFTRFTIKKKMAKRENIG